MSSVNENKYKKSQIWMESGGDWSLICIFGVYMLLSKVSMCSSLLKYIYIFFYCFGGNIETLMSDSKQNQ